MILHDITWYLILYYMTLHYITWYYMKLHYITWYLILYYMTLHDITWYYMILYDIIWYHTMSYHIKYIYIYICIDISWLSLARWFFNRGCFTLARPTFTPEIRWARCSLEEDQQSWPGIQLRTWGNSWWINGLILGTCRLIMVNWWWIDG
jgi:hypothetical protein